MIFRGATLYFNGRSQALVPGRANSFDELYVDFQREESSGGVRYGIFLHPKMPLTLQGLELVFDYPQRSPHTRFFANGYQSWSESRTVQAHEGLGRLWSPARARFPFGDDAWSEVPRGRGQAHAWTYTWLRSGEHFTLAGSLSERTGFTLFVYDAATGRLTVRKDLAGLRLEHSFPALDLWIGEGSESALFDAYFARMEQPQRPSKTPALGWTSWYRHYTGVTESIVRQNLGSIVESGLPFQYLQIDDGWQTATGDWNAVKTAAFPSGMGALSAAIREKGLTPGLWLAPFVATAKSELARRNPDWLLRDRRGRLVQAGWNPHWGGWFYALNFYHAGVRDYLSGIFHVVFDRWQYGLVKLDFLYAAALAAPEGKTRGQVMYEAVEFLQQQTCGRELLACGVPLGAAFGQVDFCRIGADVHRRWEHRLLAWLGLRERLSTRSSLRSTLGRWQLDGRAFGNDPDVFILRSDGHQLTPAQQHTLLTVNSLLGTLLFTSDDVGAYTDAQRALLDEALQWQGCTVLAVREVQPDVYQLEVKKADERRTALSNLTAREVVVGGQKLRAFQSGIY